jgi:methylated-DNA-[protein]-cysteine S-methyltransferase
MTDLYSSIMDTPIGVPFAIVADADGTVLASGWTPDPTDLVALIHPRLRAVPVPRSDLGQPTKAAQAYFDGDLSAPGTVQVRQEPDGGFLAHAWTVLREVPPGRPVSYTELAALAGRPAAVRGAALACARNATGLFVPCHRVIRADGGLAGFRWGLPVKRWLLDHEAATAG